MTPVLLASGSTLWSHVPPEHDAEVLSRREECPNFTEIFTTPHENITPALMRQEFANNVAFIQQQLQQAKPLGLKCVVLTHHAPSMEGTISFRHKGSVLNHTYATPLPHPDPSAIRLWCFGHTHWNAWHWSEGYELMSNQVGQWDQPLKFYRKDLLISL
jgi:hypothetical protein